MSFFKSIINKIVSNKPDIKKYYNTEIYHSHKNQLEETIAFVEEIDIINSILEVRTNQIALAAYNVDIMNQEEAHKSIHLLNHPNSRSSFIDLFKEIAKYMILDGSIFLEMLSDNSLIIRRKEVVQITERAYFINDQKGIGHIINIGTNSYGLRQNLTYLASIKRYALDMINQHLSHPRNLYCINSKESQLGDSAEQNQTILQNIQNIINHSNDKSIPTYLHFSNIYNLNTQGLPTLNELQNIIQFIDHQIIKSVGCNNPIMSSEAHKFASDHKEYHNATIIPHVLNIYLRINSLLVQKGFIPIQIKW